MTLLELMHQKSDSLPGGWNTIYFYALNAFVLQGRGKSQGGSQLKNRLLNSRQGDGGDLTRLIRNNFKATFTG